MESTSKNVEKLMSFMGAEKHPGAVVILQSKTDGEDLEVM